MESSAISVTQTRALGSMSKARSPARNSSARNGNEYLLESRVRMPRRFLKKITPHPTTLQNRWYVRVFGSRLADPRLWSLQRRAVTAAFGAGIAICFVPLPIHLPLAVLTAVLWRVNVPAIVATVFLVNPLTVVPIYYLAYRVGIALLGDPLRPFDFEPTWEWLRNGLGPVWKSFLLGCAVSAAALGVLGWLSLEWIWRWRVRYKYRSRPGASMT
jgi:uncharacterized protein